MKVIHHVLSIKALFGPLRGPQFACEITDGIALDCGGYTVGGITTLYLANRANVQLTRSVTPGPTLNAVTDITMLNADTFFQFDLQDGSGIATAALQGGGEGQNTSKNFLHVVGWSSPAVTQAIINVVKDIGLSRLIAIVESRTPNGAATPENRHYILGIGSGLQSQTIEGGLGQNRGDLVGFTFSLQGTEVEPQAEIRPDAVAYPSATPIAELLATLL